MKINYLRLHINGFNQMRLISSLTDAGVEMRNLNRISASEMLVDVPKKHSGKTFAILEKMCYNYKVELRSDSKALVSAAAKRSGLIAGVAVFCALLGLLYGLVWRVDVAGNEKVDSLVIRKVLSECGAGIGKPRGKLDSDKVRNAVNSIDGILESSVEIFGGTVRVTVVEDTDFVPPTVQKFSPVTSDYDAEITRIITTAGTALVSPGSRVFKGETLIGAYSLDESGNEVRTEAKGSVYGKVAFSRTETFSVRETVNVRTGRTYASSRYRLFGLNIKGREKHGFEKYETETESAYVFENLFVPLRIERTVFHEVREEEKSYDVAERVEYYKSLLADEMMIKAGGEDAEITYTLTRISEESYRINVYMEVELLIGQSR